MQIMNENYTLDISHVTNGSVKTVNGYDDACVFVSALLTMAGAWL